MCGSCESFPTLNFFHGLIGTHWLFIVLSITENGRMFCHSFNFTSWSWLCGQVYPFNKEIKKEYHISHINVLETQMFMMD